MNRIFSRLVLGASAALLAFGAGSVEAQTTFNACRVPSVGAIYMVGVAGAPAACLDASHVAFSWTEGGVPGPGSVTSAMIADGAVGAADVNSAEVQLRVSGSCLVGNAVRSVASDGTVVCQSSSGTVAGSQVVDFSTPLTVSTGASVALASVVLPGSPSGVATIEAHAYLERSSATFGRFMVELYVGSCGTGSPIGFSWWRPVVVAGGIVGTTIPVTGVVTGATGPTTVVLCSQGFDVGGPDATAYMRGITAQW